MLWKGYLIESSPTPCRTIKESLNYCLLIILNIYIYYTDNGTRVVAVYGRADGYFLGGSGVYSNYYYLDAGLIYWGYSFAGATYFNY
jgi:hypothetical protein